MSTTTTVRDTNQRPEPETQPQTVIEPKYQETNTDEKKANASRTTKIPYYPTLHTAV
jgi:hypothetical protein